MKKKLLRNASLVALSAVMVCGTAFGLAGCNNKNTNTISISMFCGVDDRAINEAACNTWAEQYTQELIANGTWEEGHEPIKIDFSSDANSESYFSTLMNQIASNSQPDVFYVSPKYVRTWSHIGRILDLSDYLAEDNETLSDIWDDSLAFYAYSESEEYQRGERIEYDEATGTYVGQNSGAEVGIYGLPKDFSNFGLSYNAIFFTEYVYASDYADSGKVLDLSSIIKDPLTEYGETRSIKDKMTKEQQDYFVLGSGENIECYVLPHYQSFRGIVYDVDLFENELLYFAANENNGNDGFVTSEGDTRSAGPDGQSGTYDDGLPATYEDFFKLCDRMVEQGIKPVIWSGSNQAYFTDFLAALALDYEGLDDAMLNFTFAGTAYNLVESIGQDGKITFMNDAEEGTGVDISPNNGYLLAKQAGKYYSLTFAEQLLQSKYIASGSMGTLSHTDAQKNVINSRPSSTEQDIGMIIEGSFWENECADMNYFNVAEKQYGEAFSRENRRFALMPYPKATEGEVGDKVTLTDSLMSGAFIRGNVTGVEKDLALDFLQFLYTDESLREFTQYTSAPKALNYDITGVEGLSYFAQSVFDMKNRADIVYPYSSAPIYADQPSSFEPTSFYQTTVHQGAGNVPYTYPSRAMYDDGVTALQYFNGLSVSRSESAWKSAYEKYFVS